MKHPDIHLDAKLDAAARPGNVLPVLAQLLHRLAQRERQVQEKPKVA
jgi:hypothetical protein